MSEAIEFDEKTARETEVLYLTPDIVAARRRVLDMLAVARGERIADIGSGPGLLAQEIAAAVGPRGCVEGVDISAPMVALARRRCANLAHVAFHDGDATALPWPDAGFDAAVSTQVYEYVPDLAQAFAELCRVLRPGGRALIMATDADSLILASPAPALSRRILDAWRAHCPHPDLPRRISPLLRGAGLDIRARDSFTLLDADFSRDRFAWHYLRSISAYAARQGRIEKAEGKAWIAELQDLAVDGGFFFSLNRYLFVAERPTA